MRVRVIQIRTSRPVYRMLKNVNSIEEMPQNERRCNIAYEEENHLSSKTETEQQNQPSNRVIITNFI